MGLTQQQREQVKETFLHAIETAGLDHLKTVLLLFNDIPAKKIANFKKRLAKNNVSVDNEEIIFFYDTTIFGSGKEGFLITDTSICKIDALGFKQVKIADIAEIHYEEGDNQGVGHMFIDMKDDTRVSYISLELVFEITSLIFSNLGFTVDEEVEKIQTNRIEKAQCQNCRAWTRQEVCEYCRTPVIREVDQSAASVAVHIEPSVTQTHQVVTGVGTADEILKLKQLMDAGVLTQEEFNHKKKMLLGL